MSVTKLVVHTDIFLEHLTCEKGPSLLRQAMSKYFCYTTVFQAIELFALVRTEREQKAVEDSMAAMKILGLNPKNARRYGELISSNSSVRELNILVAGMCLESRLPILTGRKKDFAGIKGLTIIAPAVVRNTP